MFKIIACKYCSKRADGYLDGVAIVEDDTCIKNVISMKGDVVKTIWDVVLVPTTFCMTFAYNKGGNNG